MLCDIKFIPVQQDCLLTFMYISKHIYILTANPCALHTWSTSTYMVNIDIDWISLDLQFKLLMHSGATNGSWWVVTNWTNFIRVKETKIQACHSSCPCYNSSINLLNPDFDWSV